MLVAVTTFGMWNRIQQYEARECIVIPIKIERLLSFVLPYWTIWIQINWNDRSNEIMAH